MHSQWLSHVWLFATPWTVAYRLLCPWKWFPRQKYWRGLPFPSPGDLPDQGLNPHLLHWQVGSLPLSHRGAHILYIQFISFFFKWEKYTLKQISLPPPISTTYRKKTAIQKKKKQHSKTKKLKAILRAQLSTVAGTKYMYINSHSPAPRGSLQLVFFERSVGRRWLANSFLSDLHSNLIELNRSH